MTVPSRFGVVALESSPFSSETAVSLAAMIHRTAEHFGIEPFLVCVTTDSPNVTVAVMRLYNKWRASVGMAEVAHELCVIHTINLPLKVFDKKLLETNPTWKMGYETATNLPRMLQTPSTTSRPWASRRRSTSSGQTCVVVTRLGGDVLNRRLAVRGDITD
jgi:hypothetical protein